MNAWLYTILRNVFYTEFRKARREVADTNGQYAARLAVRPVQEGHMHFMNFRAALGKLTPDHQEALILVGASGLSYEDAARICGCAVGTMKSRVNRGRAKLAGLLCDPIAELLVVDWKWQAAVDASWSGSRAVVSDV
jgi:RNA polymerase sigma-70 factor (ECF subfamily)